MFIRVTYKFVINFVEYFCQEEHPWSRKTEYCRPVTPMEGCTTYKLSYWPHCEKPRESIRTQENENVLNASCCFDDNTTYRLSYFGCGGDKPPDPIRQTSNMVFSSCPLSHDTVNRVSRRGIAPPRCAQPDPRMTR